MAVELPRPGVEVVQVFKTVSPTVVTPTLPPSIVGVCKQVVEVLTASAAGAEVLNDDARVPLQAVLVGKDAVGSPAVYAGIDGKSLVLSFNNGPNVEFPFVGATLSAAQVVATLLLGLGNAGVTAFAAQKVKNGFRIRSLAGDDYQTIQVMPESDPEVLSAFGLAAGKEYSGASYYNQRALDVATTSFPDPQLNLSQLAIEPSTVRAFLYMGGSNGAKALLPLLQTEAFLQSGTASAAKAVGTVDLTTLTLPSAIGSGTLVLSIAGTSVTATFSDPANPAAIVAQLNAAIGANALASLDGTNHLVIASTATGADASVNVIGGTAASALGLAMGDNVGAAGVVPVDTGSGTQVTPILELSGAAFLSSATSAQLVGTVALSGLTLPAGLEGKTLTLEDGGSAQTVTFADAAAPADVLSQLNALFGGAAGGKLMATLNGQGKLVITHSALGQESVIKVTGGTAASVLGLTSGATVRGNGFPPQSGDALFVDGLAFALITQVAPGGNPQRIKIDKQVSLATSVGKNWYIVAKNLVAGGATSGLTRPTPNLTIDDAGNIHLKPEVLRDVSGAPVANARAQLYVAYRALRLDVTPKAANPGLLRFSDTTTLQSNLSPISVDNPLGLGVYFALLNAPNTLVTAIGVDEVTGNEPYGTVEGFTRAATFLEAYEVYAVVPLTHDDTVSQVFAAHVTTMSLPENKGERITLINPSMPTTKLDTLVASGVDGNTTGNGNQFDTSIVQLGALLLAQGKSGMGPYAVTDGIFLDVGDGEKYAVVNVVGSTITVKTSGFLPGENDDAFYATTALPMPLIEETFAVRIRGAALTLPDGSPDRESAALTVAQTAQGYANRRVWSVFPDKAAALLGGVEQVVEGFYVNAAIAGMIARQPPQQSFTNFPMTGFTRIIGSNDRYSTRQLNIMAGGGNYIVVQDADAAPLIARMALTTDVTSVETRTDSITKVVDFAAKFLRQGLKNFIGRFNITQGFLDSLGHVLQGLLSFLVEAGVLIGANVNNIIQDTTSPDTVLIDVLLDVPYPCNYLRLTLAV